jgi:hypothetical protein
MKKDLKLSKLPSWNIPLVHKNVEERKKIAKKHKTHSGAQKVESLIKIEINNFDMIYQKKNACFWLVFAIKF